MIILNTHVNPRMETGELNQVPDALIYNINAIFLNIRTGYITTALFVKYKKWQHIFNKTLTGHVNSQL